MVLVGTTALATGVSNADCHFVAIDGLPESFGLMLQMVSRATRAPGVPAHVLFMLSRGDAAALAKDASDINAGNAMAAWCLRNQDRKAMVRCRAAPLAGASLAPAAPRACRRPAER
jgi:hypothetical protein